MDGSRPSGAAACDDSDNIIRKKVNFPYMGDVRKSKSLFLIMSELMAYANQNWVSKFMIMILYTALSMTKCRTLGTVIAKSFGGAVDPYSLYR